MDGGVALDLSGRPAFCSSIQVSRHETTTVSGNLSGKVVAIDDTGNLVTDIPSTSLSDAPTDASLRVVVDEHETFGLYPLDHSQPSMTLVAIIQQDGPLRIVLVDDSASAMLGVRVGATVEVHW